MKILHIITRLILGGAQKNTLMCAHAQGSARHQVHLAYGPIYGPEGSLLQEAQKANIQTHEIKSMHRELMPWHDLKCYFALRKLIREIKPDVVHTHSSKAGILGRLAAWQEKVPTVIHTIHGLPFHAHQSRLKYHLYVTAEKIAAKRCHKLIGITHAMVIAFKENNIGQNQQFRVIPSGISLTDFQRETTSRKITRKAYGIAQEAVVVGLLARLDPLKGHDDLLDIYSTLQKLPEDVYYLFVGDGWHREALENRIKKNKWEDRVILAGLVPPMQVASLLHAMDIMVLPSYQEGQGRTLVEALLCGCAIAGYDAGGIGEICINNQTGKLVDVGNQKKLAAALTTLIQDSPQRAKLAAAGKKHVIENFSEAVMLKKLDTLYAELTNGNK